MSSNGRYEKVKVESNSISTQRGKKIQFNISPKTVSAKIKSPSRKEITIRNINNGIIQFSFDEVGKWEVDAYDRDGIASDWIKVDVF